MLFLYLNMFISILTEVYTGITTGQLAPEDMHLASQYIAARLENDDNDDDDDKK